MGVQVEVTKLPMCDFCSQNNDDHGTPVKEALYDGKTTMGPWADMCQHHFERFGVGLGTGVGQRLVVRDA